MSLMPLPSSPPLAERKEILRADIYQRLSHLSEKDREAESRSVVLRLLEIIREDIIICGYIPLNTEANIRPFLEEILKRGQPLYLPTFDGHSVFLRKTEDLHHLTVSQFHIPEPPKDGVLLDPNVPVIAIIPGRAFDARGARCGRGNGAYDRWIAERRKTSPESLYYGAALECQIVGEVPMAEHDQFLDGIVTARGLLEKRM